jgi:NTE family protein
VDHLDRFRAIIASSADAADMRRRMGAVALEADAASDGSRQAQWRGIVASRLPGAAWPERRVLITAVDAQTGEPVEFDRDSGAELVDAVAASTSGGGSSYAIGGGRYIDGGYRRSSENADLAAGSERVLVLSPLGGKTLYPAEWGMELAVQVDELRAGGSTVEVIVPDRDDEHLFGANAMDFSLRPAAAQAGYDQGRALAPRLTEFWG